MHPFVRLKAEELLTSSGFVDAPVDPLAIASHLKIDVRFERFVGDLSGVLMRRDDHTVIAVNKADSTNRQRFTIAHELGHYALGHKGDLFVDHTIMNRRDSRSSMATDVQEMEANSFAAELLMPSQLVLEKANSLLLQDAELSQKGLLKRLAGAFHVSEQAMTFRLMNLGFLEIDALE